MSETAVQHKLLEDFVTDNSDLVRLEQLLDEFNIFDAIGMRYQEIRHSAFLAFLLDARANHGLSDSFLRHLLQQALLYNREKQLPVSVIDLDVWDLDDVELRREWQNIDILVLLHQHRVAVIIENKVYSGEHSNQLSRYYDRVSSDFKGWKIIPLFLTPDAGDPTDLRYLRFSYGQVAALVESTVTARGGSMGPDVRTLMTHYSKMLRRHLVSGSEIDDLCQRIYRRHKAALDLIFERRPDRTSEVQAELVKIIQETPGLKLRQSAKTWIGFHPVEWDCPILQGTGGPNAQALVLEYYFQNTPELLQVTLYINGGDIDVRQRLLDLALKNRPPFDVQTKSLNQNANRVFRKTFMKKDALEQMTIDEIAEILRQQWEEFINHELQIINGMVDAESWLWESAETA